MCVWDICLYTLLKIKTDLTNIIKTVLLCFIIIVERNQEIYLQSNFF